MDFMNLIILGGVIGVVSSIVMNKKTSQKKK
jgi:uncharacterized membrane protein YeaQ/YmgE (transglycosylase-associated protein family)